jgi:hypothetical protein
MTEHQRETADLAAKILSGILAGQLQKPGFEPGHIGLQEINLAVTVAINLQNVIRQRVPPNAS